MYLAFVFGALILVPNLFSHRSLLMALGVLVILGVLDDMHDLTPTRKFLGQIFAATLMTSWGGVYVSHLGDLFGLGTVLLWDWAIPFTVVCSLGLINALNMSDGMDGLAGGIALIAFIWLGIFAVVTGMNMQAQLIFLMASALLGFLYFNMSFSWREHADVFMGNSGSMMLGLALAWFSIELTQGQNSERLSPITAVWVIALPLLDMGSTILRRVMKGRSPFSPDREHLHHILLQAGYSVRHVVWILVGISALFGAVGFVTWYVGVPDLVMFYTFMSLLTLYYYAVHRAGKTMKHIRRTHNAASNK